MIRQLMRVVVQYKHCSQPGPEAVDVNVWSVDGGCDYLYATVRINPRTVEVLLRRKLDSNWLPHLNRALGLSGIVNCNT